MRTRAQDDLQPTPCPHLTEGLREPIPEEPTTLIDVDAVQQGKQVVKAIPVTRKVIQNVVDMTLDEERFSWRGFQGALNRVWLYYASSRAPRLPNTVPTAVIVALLSRSLA